MRVAIGVVVSGSILRGLSPFQRLQHSRRIANISYFIIPNKIANFSPTRYFFRMSTTSIFATPEATSILDKPAQLAVRIFEEAVESVKPKNLLTEKFKLENDSEIAIDAGDGSWKRIDLKQFKKLYVVGFGKAVLPMAEQVMRVLGERIKRCIVVIPEGFRNAVVKRIEIYRGAKNNIPDAGAFLGSIQIVDLVQSLQPDDLLIVLITGGGSALFTYPLHPIKVEELGSLVKSLSRAGASINELNSVRKRLSLVKGGGLLSLCRSDTLVGLILSDVMEDPLDIIASGPTVPNTDLESLAQEIISKYVDATTLPTGIQTALSNPVVTPPPKSVTNVIIGNNTVALETGAETAKRLNLFPYILTKTLSGEASEVGESLANAAHALSYLFRAKKGDPAKTAYISTVLKTGGKLDLEQDKVDELLERVQNPGIQSEYDGVCVLLGGETTVNVRGTGVGGRNQELALSAGRQMDTGSNNSWVKGKVALLSAGTDGFDGPCDAAGAVVDSSMLRRGYDKKLSPTEHLEDNNSYQYFKANANGAYHIVTGHTETNVMDLVLIVIVK